MTAIVLATFKLSIGVKTTQSVVSVICLSSPKYVVPLWTHTHKQTKCGCVWCSPVQKLNFKPQNTLFSKWQPHWGKAASLFHSIVQTWDKRSKCVSDYSHLSMRIGNIIFQSDFLRTVFLSTCAICISPHKQPNHPITLKSMDIKRKIIYLGAGPRNFSSDYPFRDFWSKFWKENE